MIHKRYMDLINTSPTFILFYYLLNTSLQWFKAIVNTKTVCGVVLAHQTLQK